MATEKQKQAARENIRKAQEAWKSRSSKARSRAQPSGRERKLPGSTGEGDYFHIEVRGKEEFTTFRTQDVGRPGNIQRVAGKRSSGSWDTQKWLIGKQHAHVEGGRLVPDTDEARDVIDNLGSEPRRQSADRFRAKPRPNVPEDEKPTPAQQSARRRNIKKAQEARRKS